MGVRTAGSTTSRVKRRVIARRQDLQTIPRLDQLYQSAIGEACRDVLTLLLLQQQRGGGNTSDDDDDLMESTIRSLGRLVIDVGGGVLMLRLGSVVFRKGIDRAGLVRDGCRSPLSLARDAYVRVLSNVLQCCTDIPSLRLVPHLHSLLN